MASKRRHRDPATGPEMKMVRVNTATSYPLHPEDIGIVNVPVRVAKGLLDSGQAMEVCGKNREIAIAALCSAAEKLDVTLTTTDPEVDATALRYGARCTLRKG